MFAVGLPGLLLWLLSFELLIIWLGRICTLISGTCAGTAIVIGAGSVVVVVTAVEDVGAGPGVATSDCDGCVADAAACFSAEGFWWINVLKWALRWWARVNRFPHSSQLKGWQIGECTVQWLQWMVTNLYRFSPVCVNLWALSTCEYVNVLPQVSHLYGRSPVWVLKFNPD